MLASGSSSHSPFWVPRLQSRHREKDLKAKQERKHGNTPRSRFLARYVIITKQNNYKHCSVFTPCSIWTWSFYSFRNVPFQTNCQHFFLLLAVEGWVQFVIVMDPWYAWLWTSNTNPLPENTRWKERNNSVMLRSQRNMLKRNSKNKNVY